MGALLVGLDTMANLINRCKIYEMLYLDDRQAGQAFLNLETALVNLYVAMLRFLTSANVLYDSSTGVRILRFMLEPGKVAEFVDKCVKSCRRKLTLKPTTATTRIIEWHMQRLLSLRGY